MLSTGLEDRWAKLALLLVAFCGPCWDALAVDESEEREEGDEFVLSRNAVSVNGSTLNC
jgi:hypothetical protein